MRWPDSSEAWVSSLGPWELEVNVAPAKDLRGHLTGLLGNFDGHSGNDLVTRAGQLIKNTPFFHDLYQVFGDSWRIHQSESLFDYAPGQSTATFTNRRIPSRPVSAADLPNGQAATAICRSLGITTPKILQACALDVAATGQAAFSDSAMAAQQRAAPGCTSLPYAAVRGATIGKGAESCFRLQAAAGDVVHLHLTGANFPDVHLISPRGNDICSSNGASDFDCTAGAAGTYTIIVRNGSAKVGETFKIWVQRLNNPVGCTALPYAAVTGATIGKGAESCFRLQAAAGDVVHLHLTGANFPDVHLISPRGNDICSSNGASDFDCTAGAAGTYTIIVRNGSAKVGETFKIWVQRLNNPVGCTALPYAAVTGATIGKGAESCFRLQAAAGDVVHMHLTGVNFPDVHLISPRGNDICSSNGASDFDCTAGAAGTYTIIVRNGSAKVGETFKIWATRKAS